MHKKTPSLPAEAESLKRFYAALNRNDIPATLEVLDPEVEWSDPAEAPGAGTHRGLAAVEAHFARARMIWAEGSCEPERFIVAGDRIVVFVHVRVRLKHETEWREADLADVYTFRDGRVIVGRSFADRRQGLEWAGVDSSEAG